MTALLPFGAAAVLGADFFFSAMRDSYTETASPHNRYDPLDPAAGTRNACRLDGAALSAVAAAMVGCIVGSVLFGATTPLVKVLLSGGATPVALAGLLYLGAALGVLPFAWQGERPRLNAANRWRLAGVVVCGGVAAPVLFCLALRASPAASGSLWLTLETVATALLARIFFHDRLGRRSWLGYGLVVLAGALLAGSAHLGAPALLTSLACLLWGLDNNLTALIDGMTAAQLALLKGVAAAAVNLSLAGWLEGGTWEARSM